MTMVQLNQGTERVILRETPAYAATTRREFTITSDAVMLSAVVHAVVGSVTIELYSTVDGQQSLLISFPAVTTPTTSPLTDRSPITNGALRLVVTNTGACDYTVQARAVGSGSSTVSGSVTVTNFPVTQPVSGSVAVTNFPAPVAENIRQQILKAEDRTQVITYADFGTPTQRVTRVEYAAISVGPQVARKDLTYTLVGTRYRRDSIDWSII